MSENIVWHNVCGAEDLEEEDVLGVEIGGKRYALYRTAAGYFATDGLCTHEGALLADGFVTGDVIECAKHNARFHIPTGKALRKPAIENLRTYPVKLEGGDLFIGFSEK